MRLYNMKNVASANIQCCGVWLQVGSRLIGIAPRWWFSNRSRKGPVRRLGLTILSRDYSCGMRAALGLEVGKSSLRYTTRGEASPGHYRWDEVGLKLRF